jgi:hypothetical protein
MEVIYPVQANAYASAEYQKNKSSIRMKLIAAAGRRPTIR